MILKTLISLSYVVGVFFAAMAILRSRTPQGATAWVMSLLGFPFISVPLYILFGRNRFDGYNIQRKILDSHIQNDYEDLIKGQEDYSCNPDKFHLISRLVDFQGNAGFSHRNRIDLLIDSDETYPEMLKAINEATNYIIFQFYIFRVDQIGRTFINALVRKSKSGVRVTIMNDAIGARLPDIFIKEMEDAGIQTGIFNEGSYKGKFQINFRNHRKIIIVDGKVAFLGGMNIGDDYRGKDKRLGHWRDTHVKIQGPAVLAAQLASAKDWYCIHKKKIQAEWIIHPAQEDASVLVLNTGPADNVTNCLFSYISLINSAKTRLWIANPYFVPPESLMDAILLASMKGVDVRIILPGVSDALTIMLASKVYQKTLLQHGVKIYHYKDGFLHQKTMLIDNDHAVVGSVNLDCRSMFINFEIAAISDDKTFVADCEKMFIRDFESSEPIQPCDLLNRSLMDRIISRGANLLAPIL